MALEEVLVVLSQLWKVWNIQGFMILSLVMQLVLALMAPLRKKTSNSAVILIVWLAYLLADWSAIYAFGLISNIGRNNSPSNLDGSNDLLALWASFLLIHLGGPDTITAFSLEDNALWFRHLVGLIARVFTFFYIFNKIIPNKMLMAPTLLVFATGVIKYGERIRALYLASLKNFKDTQIVFRDKGSNNIVKVLEDLQVSSDSPRDKFVEALVGFHFFKGFKNLIVNILPNHSQMLESRRFFLNREAELAFEIIAIELSLLYEVIYTKIIAAYSSWGFFIRNFAYFMSIAALIIFCSIKKDELKAADIHITYALLAGVIALDSTSELMLATSNWRPKNYLTLTKEIIVRGVIPYLINKLIYVIVRGLLHVCGCKSYVKRSWSSKMGSFNLLAYSFEEGSPRNKWPLNLCCRAIFGSIRQTTGIELRKIKDEIDKMRYTKKISMDNGIWKHIFDILRERASNADDADPVKKIHEARGELALQHASDKLKRYVTEFGYGHSVLLWHVATEICYNTDTKLEKDNKNVKFGKILSDYMMYLMVNQPDMMSAVADNFHQRYRHASRKLKELGAETLEELCSTVSEKYRVASELDHEDGREDEDILADSCRLVKILKETDNKWEITCKVWVELLLYAAGHCRADSHAQLMSRGGEFVSFVWLLMAHFGIGSRFPKD